MHRRFPLLLRAIAYGLRGGFLVRPFVIAVALGAAGALLSSAEERVPTLGAWVPFVLFPSRQDPQVAQVILSVIATSIMTVVSIVFAILLMTLTLASTQFSPRILISFVRDKNMQWTLGVFLGTFCYCMAAMPAARSLPTPFVPVVTVSGAMLLALVAVGWLVFFIHHISQSISVNNIVDRIARETEEVIDELMPEQRRFESMARPVEMNEAATPIPSQQSGYIRFIDIHRLLDLAKAWRIRVRVERRVGQFIPAGVPLIMVSREDRLDPLRITELLGAFDIGPTRTLQQDVEFGVIMIVDIALRAISPAVNDPSTAISCIDQLSRVLIRWLGRAPPEPVLYDPPHVARVLVPWIGIDGMFDTAFEQIRHYAATDLAVSLRLLRAIMDIGQTVQRSDIKAALLDRAQRVVEGWDASLGEVSTARLRQRLAAVEATLRGAGYTNSPLG
ncbi:MAG TPA: DUF2254 domain-containing protein [Acetobacteraceae bacterium]|jgi:uncharacterized membrane protein|nr:DUF2254 domain-containing protein [Acetobacteraceae bacterium]